MARTLLLVPSKQLDPLALSLYLLSAIFLLAMITLISALCASHHRKSRPVSSPQPTSIPSSEEREEKITVLPATHGPIGPTEQPSPTKPTTPRRKLSFSMSLKLAEGLTRVRTGRTEAPAKERAASEDSTWMKAIILGEKCRVPDSVELEDEENFGYDEKGNRRRNYHPRTPRSMPVSRTNSFISPSST